MSKARYWTCGFLLLIVVAGLVLFPMMIRAFDEQARVRSLEPAELDPASAADGEHSGSFSYGEGDFAVTVAVVVEVADGRIVSIAVTENEDRSHPQSAEAVLPRVIAEQSLSVDAVSGATTTSKALLKAVEDALLSAGAVPL
jgi:uncharacterized protein with FMN-binding domain